MVPPAIWSGQADVVGGVAFQQNFFTAQAVAEMDQTEQHQMRPEVTLHSEFEPRKKRKTHETHQTT